MFLVYINKNTCVVLQIKKYLKKFAMKKNIIIVAVNIHKYKSIIENPIIKKYYKFYFLKYIYFLFIMQIMYSVVQKIKKLQSNNKLRLI